MDKKHESHIDPEAVARRTGTKLVDHEDRLSRLEPVVMVIDARTKRMEGKLDRVLVMPRAVQVAAIVAAFALVVIAYATAFAHR